MAIELGIPSQYGVEAKYWNISFIQNNFTDKVLYIKLFGYPTREIREVMGTTPISVIELSFRDIEYPGDISREGIYTLIKTLPEFNGAIDIL